MAAYALPLKLNIVVAIAAAVAAGFMMEQADRAAETARRRMTTTDGFSGALAILGLAVVTVVTRASSFSRARGQDSRLVAAGLKVAPLAALAAVVVPEVIMTHGALIATWQDARLPP